MNVAFGSIRMQSHQLAPSPSSSLFFALLLVSCLIITTLSSSSAHQHERNLDCSPQPYECGNVKFNISYPFQTDGHPMSCAYSEAAANFSITCNKEDNTSEIVIRSNTYHVKDIDYKHQTAILVHKDYFLDDSWHSPRNNTSIDFRFFNFTPGDAGLLVLENCSDYYPDGFTLPNIKNSHFRFLGCLSNQRDSRYAYMNSQSIRGLESPIGVDDQIEIDAPLLGKCPIKKLLYVQDELDISERLVENFGKEMSQGFQVSWSGIEPNNLCWRFNHSHLPCFYSMNDPLRPSCVPVSADSGKSKAVKYIAGACAGVGAVLLILAALLLALWLRRKRLRSISSKLLGQNISSDPYLMLDLEKSSSFMATQFFDYNELEEATNNFDHSKELGDGGFGVVYHGKLRDGRNVAVKRLYENNCRCVEQFKNEIKILSQLRHQSLVALYGCSSRHSRELLLVYEFIPNGTLADHLHGDCAKPATLSWPTRMCIAIETADALKYLHAVEIVHRDVKTNNILLDNSFHVKVADFGLSRLFPTNVTHISTAPQGTPGYVDPEYHRCYQLTDKSDVYSFGVVLAELISSKPAVDISRHRHEINLADLVIIKIHSGALNELVDPSLGFDSDYRINRTITSVAELAFRCLQDDKDIRPSMEEVWEVLMGIESEEYEVGKIDEVNTTADDEVLLKKMPPLSPNTVTEAWESRHTTPNTTE